MKNKINLPEFVADFSLSYTTKMEGKTKQFQIFKNEVILQRFSLGFSCDKSQGSCRCEGFWDCVDMIFNSNVCKGQRQCYGNVCFCPH